MRDTSVVVDDSYRRFLSRVSGEQRLIFASESSESAKTLVAASFSGTEDELLFKKKLFLRFYQSDFDDLYIKKFFECLAGNCKQ